MIPAPLIVNAPERSRNRFSNPRNYLFGVIMDATVRVERREMILSVLRRQTMEERLSPAR